MFYTLENQDFLRLFSASQPLSFLQIEFQLCIRDSFQVMLWDALPVGSKKVNYVENCSVEEYYLFI